MSRFARPSLWLLALAMMMLTGCQGIRAHFPRVETASQSSVETTARVRSHDRPRFDPGLIRTQYERDDAPSPPPERVVEARVSSEQKIGIHLDLGRVLESQGREPDALEEYRRAVEAFRETRGRLRGDFASRSRLHRKLAQAFDHLGHPEEARTHYQTAQKLTPREPNVWNDAGYSAFFQGHFDEAQRLLRRAEELDPANPRILTNLGMALAASGQINPALEALTKAGGPVSARINLAYVLASTGHPDQAREQYRAALAIDPSLNLARSALVRLDAREATRTAEARPTPRVNRNPARPSTRR